MQRTCSIPLQCLFLAILSFHSAAALDVKPLQIGQPAPDFTLPGVDGKNHSLADYKDASVLVILFTCNHCPTAQAYEGRIKQLAANYKEKGVAIVAISPNDPLAVRLDELGYSDLNDSLEDMKLRAEHKEFNFPYLYDGETQEVSKKYGPQATPHAFVFDRDRILRYVGGIDDDEKADRTEQHFLKQAIDELLAGKEVSIPKTKTFGCSIKWADKRDTVDKAFEQWAKEEVTLEKVDKEGLAEIIANDTDKLRLVNVWATWCGPCVTEFPHLVEIYRMYRGRPFEMITVCGNDPDDYGEALDFLKKQQASGRNVIFDSYKSHELVDIVDEEWGGGMPHTLLIKPGGEIVYRHNQEIDPLEVKREIVKIIGNTY